MKPQDLTPQTRADYTVEQHWEQYTAEDHAIWRELFDRQQHILQGRACDEFMAGLEKLEVCREGIPDFRRLSDILTKLTGWSIVTVPGLIPGEAFHGHLAQRQFPISFWIRSREQIDYLKEPDVFHDLYGHVPMLTNPIFADYMQEFGKAGVRATKLGYEQMLTRLYWYTVEFGLINTKQGLRIYGSGIVSSKTESVYSLESDVPNRIMLDVPRMLRTRYRSNDLQRSYFVIDSFEQLFDATAPDFLPLYEQAAKLPELAAKDVLPTDVVIHRGTVH